MEERWMADKGGRWMMDERGMADNGGRKMKEEERESMPSKGWSNELLTISSDMKHRRAFLMHCEPMH